MLNRKLLHEKLTRITGELASGADDTMEQRALLAFQSTFTNSTESDIRELFQASKSAGLTMKRPNDYLLAAVVMVSDQNSDGKIDHEELLDIMKLYNWVPDDISKSELDSLMRQTLQSLDSNKDGIISPKELLFGIMKKIHIERKFYTSN